MEVVRVGSALAWLRLLREELRASYVRLALTCRACQHSADADLEAAAGQPLAAERTADPGARPALRARHPRALRLVYRRDHEYATKPAARACFPRAL